MISSQQLNPRRVSLRADRRQDYQKGNRRPIRFVSIKRWSALGWAFLGIVVTGFVSLAASGSQGGMNGEKIRLTGVRWLTSP
jgi:hypothetical protein